MRNLASVSETKGFGIGIGGVLVVLLLIWTSVTIVGPGQRGVLMTFGKVEKGVLGPGLNFKWPWIQTVKLLDVRIQKSEQLQSAASKDLQEVTTRVAVNWSIDPGDAEWVYQNLGNEAALVNKVIDPTVANAVKAVTATYNAEELIAQRDKIRRQIQQQIIQGLTRYRVQVEGVNITNFKFSPDYTQAIERKQVAQQRAQQAQYDLQRVEIEAQQKIAQAKGEAESQRLLQQTLTPEIIRWNAIQKWNGVLPQVVGGTGVIPFIGAMTAPSKASSK